MTAQPRPPKDDGFTPEASGFAAAEDAVGTLLDGVVGLAVAGIPGVDGASVTVLHPGSGGGRFETVSVSSERVRRADEAQYRDPEGPGVDAIRGGVEVRSAADRRRWPRFAAAAAEVGIQTVWSLPLQVRGRTTGALNLYAGGRPGWDPDAVRLVRVLAAQAAAAVTTGAALSQAEMANEALRRALRTQELIGQAEGILMARQHVDGGAAFDMLRRASQRTNRKLRDLAADIAEDAARRPSRSGRPDDSR